MFDSTRLRAELAHIHRTLSGVAAGPRGKELLDGLRREIDGTSAALLWQSLFADCLRVVHSAITADGVIGDDEIAALYELMFSVARHYAGVLPSRYGAFAVADDDSIRAFLSCYAADTGPFGHGAARPWPGLALCRGAAEIGEAEALERYERMMTWLISAACEIGGVTEGDRRWKRRTSELRELRRALVRTAKLTSPTRDLRLQAFLSQPGVFSAVQQASSVFDADPLDVETIHQDARATFEQMVERATSSTQLVDRGRMMLVLGDSGSGKTHLLRGFLRHVQEYQRGFVAYAQLHSASDDYARYLLQHVVDSLARPYAGPSGEHTGLHELARGLARLVDEPLKAQVLGLAEGDWETPNTLPEYVNLLTDRLLQHPELSKFDPDLLRVLLYALHPDQRTTSRAYKYLRCEDMNGHDRHWIGDVVPRLDKGDPLWMIRNLARLAHVTRRAALVLMVDQAELAGFETSVGGAFRRAVDTLHSIVSEVPSAIAVVACLTDLYKEVRGGLTKFALDRLENDPPHKELHLNRSYAEIEAIIGRRLSWLFARAGAVYRPETPVYPIPEAALRRLVNRRTRDVLEWCHQYQARCAAAGKLVELPEELDGVDDLSTKVTPPSDEHDLDQIAAAWNDALHAPGIDLPDSEDDILAAVTVAAKACADEIGLSVVAPPRKNGVLRLQLAGAKEHTELAIGITNRGYQRGAFGTQVEGLRRAAGRATPVAVRTLEFPSGPACNQVVAQLLKAGGRRAYVDGSTLRTVVALQKFQPPFPADRVAAWRRRDRPISTLPPMAELFDLERLQVAAGDAATTAPTAVSDAPTAPVSVPIAARRTTPATGVPSGNGAARRPRPATTGDTTPALGVPTVAPPCAQQLRVGTAASFGAEPRSIEVSSLLRHTGILGSPGSGKTTLALNLIEQALERDVAVVLVDRKGDLAGYARPDWWSHTSDPARARRLAERVDVRLFTPGTRGGRPLSLSVVPDLAEIPEHERDRMVQHAANALGAMMHLGNTKNDGACRAILAQAIAVLAERNVPSGLGELIVLLEDRDEALLARAGRYDDKLFRRLVQDLETVRLSDADLFDPAAERLTAETLIGRRADDRVPLAIASTRFLGDVERVQSWVAHLIACLNRHAAKSPSAELRTLFMIDEADLFMPAGMVKPPSKEPLQDLLKRARAAGLGVVLASQSPADFDYRSREQINTWFLGRIADQRSIDKMKPLFEHRPQVGGKLGTLEAGRFVLLQDGGAADLERTPSLLRTEQLAEAELMALAARSRERG